MAQKHAKVLETAQVDKTKIIMDRKSMTPRRDKMILALSHKAGVRAGEIAEMHFDDILDASGRLQDKIFVSARGAKYGKHREVPMHPELRAQLAEYVMMHAEKSGPMFTDRFGKRITANAVAQLLKRAYERADLKGCSSHSGRRTFITSAARKAAKVGCSLRDVQILAGHASLRTTELYIDPSPNAAALVALL